MLLALLGVPKPGLFHSTLKARDHIHLQLKTVPCGRSGRVRARAGSVAFAVERDCTPSYRLRDVCRREGVLRARHNAVRNEPVC
jgi:hypothetical protein